MLPRLLRREKIRGRGVKTGEKAARRVSQRAQPALMSAMPLDSIISSIQTMLSIMSHKYQRFPRGCTVRRTFGRCDDMLKIRGAYPCSLRELHLVFICATDRSRISLIQRTYRPGPRNVLKRNCRRSRRPGI